MCLYLNGNYVQLGIFLNKSRTFGIQYFFDFTTHTKKTFVN